MFRKLISLSILALMSINVYSEVYTIDKAKIDEQKIYCGNAESFEKPAEIDFNKIFQFTEEYRIIKENKNMKQTAPAKYYLLVSKANEKAIKSIIKTTKDKKFDLTVDKGYLENLSPQFKNKLVDITVDTINTLKDLEKDINYIY